jgi:hypothetical protein
MNPGPLFIIRNHFYLLLLAFTFSALINFENTKILLFLATTTKNPKRTLLYCFRLLSSLVYFPVILLLLFYFTNTETLCLTTTRWSWGHKARTCFVGCWKRLERRYLPDPREFDINPRVTLVGKRRLLHHS